MGGPEGLPEFEGQERIPPESRRKCIRSHKNDTKCAKVLQWEELGGAAGKGVRKRRG